MTEVLDGAAFHSILWPRAADAARATDADVAPPGLHDLNLDQVIAAIDKAWPDEQLTGFFQRPAQDIATVNWRQAVLRDLERASVRAAIADFVDRLRAMRARLAGIEKLFYQVEKERAHLAAAAAYTRAVERLAAALTELPPESAGLQDFQRWLDAYVASAAFRKLRDDAEAACAALDAIRYDLLLRGGSVTVRPFADAAEASVAVAATFAKFRSDGDEPSPPPRGRIGFNGLNHIEAQIVDKLALLYPAPFATLDAFCAEHAEFIDPVVARFAREVCFSLAWLRYIAPLRAAGLAFCYPALQPRPSGVGVTDGFDLALAAKLVTEQRPVVRNDFALAANKRVLVVTGPNHGGKTTFARMFGQLHWLGMLGLTVPGSHAELQAFDALFTHFERAERVESLRGKLKDDLVRIHAILEHATPASLVVMNEIFASTTLDDALVLGRRVMQRLAQLGVLTVCVTFLTELADFDAATVSMVAGVDPADPAIRTFKLARRPADGLAYALAVARKYGVTQAGLLERIAP